MGSCLNNNKTNPRTCTRPSLQKEMRVPCRTALLLPVAFALLVPSQAASASPVGYSKPVPHETLNLDLPPIERWVEIGRKHAAGTQRVVNAIKAIAPKVAFDLAADVLAGFDDLLGATWADELRGVANGTGIPLGDIVLVNLYEELTNGCTSIIAQTEAGVIIHGRNQDLSIPFLPPIVINVNVTRGGQPLYRMITYSGYIGAPTGVRPGVFSISLDARSPTNGSVWDNVLAFFRDGASPVSFLSRKTLEEATTFEGAVTQLASEPLICPVYYIMGGVRPNEGAVISRARLNASDIWRLQPPGRFYLVETNYDHWLPVPKSDPRRTVANDLMAKSTPATVSLPFLNHVLTTVPVFNPETTYTALMCAGNGTLDAVTRNEHD